MLKDFPFCPHIFAIRRTACLLSLFILLLFSSPLQSQQVSDPEILQIISLIDSVKIRENIQILENFGTRFAFYETRLQAADFIYSRFSDAGIPVVEKDSFYAHYSYHAMDTTILQINVIATIPGSLYPDQIIILGAHYDSNLNQVAIGDSIIAPGADDNASGTAAVLEIARVIAQSGIQPLVTLKFVAFSAEELMGWGYSGSERYADSAFNNNHNIKLMCNLDMIGNSNHIPGFSDTVRVIGNEPFGEIARGITESFTDLIPVAEGSISSDAGPFSRYLYKVLYIYEKIRSPYYHSPEDLLIHIDINYCTEITKVAAASLFKAQNHITGIEDKPMPFSYDLFQNYPNPFNPVTTITYSIPENSFIQLVIMDALGREIRKLLNEEKAAGTYNISFDAAELSSGVYYYQLRAGELVQTKKMVLVK